VGYESTLSTTINHHLILSFSAKKIALTSSKSTVMQGIDEGIAIVHALLVKFRLTDRLILAFVVRPMVALCIDR
jgi:hypothetical protein